MPSSLNPLATGSERTTAPRTARFLLDAIDLASPGLFAVGVQTSSVSGRLVVQALAAALAVGRRCVLVTPLDPTGEDFRRFYGTAAGAPALGAALRDGTLQLFGSRGGYAVNLCLHGALAYVQELERFGVPPDALVVVDEADDLFTPHDAQATVAQARLYRDWCVASGRTLLQLHLRTSAARPLLDGNQAALNHFDGIARVTAGLDGPRLEVDHWAAPPSASPPPLALAAPGRERADVRGPRPRVWYVGEPDGAVLAMSDRLRWRVVPRVEEILNWHGLRRGMCILVSLDESTPVREVATQLAGVREAFGAEVRIGVREPRTRLREHVQRRLLVRCGADVVAPHGTPLDALLDATLRSEREPRAAALTPGAASRELEALTAMSAAADDGGGHWHDTGRFADLCRDILCTSEVCGVPCALVEFSVGDAADIEAMRDDRFALRPGDHACADGDTCRIFLSGCSGFDAIDVVRRAAGRVGFSRLAALRVATAVPAIHECLDALARPTVALAAVSDPRQTPRRGKVRRAASAAVLAAVVAGGGLLAAPPSVQAQAEAAERDDAFTRAYFDGRYQDAARLGRERLARAPSDAAARLQWANSLAWTGQLGAAREQYRALLGTPLAVDAHVGLANMRMWEGQPELALTGFRAALAIDPDHVGAATGRDQALQRLRPTTTLRRIQVADTTEATRGVWVASHRVRDASRQQSFEVGLRAGDERRDGAAPVADQSPRALTFAYEHAALPGAPRVAIARQSSPLGRTFGDVTLRTPDRAFSLVVGRVNWGEIAFDPRALAAGLSADRLGVAGAIEGSVGRFTASANRYGISDGNRIDELNTRLVPGWQPLAQAWSTRWFVGTASRTAERVDPRYWSPAAGHHVAEGGIAWSRWESTIGASVELKRSFRLGGEGTAGWGGSVAGRWTPSADWAVVVDASRILSGRGGAQYASTQATVAVERSWR